MLIFALLILMMLPSYYAGTYCREDLNKYDWEVWVPHRLLIAQTQDITLQPEFDVYPVGTVAVRFALKNFASDTFYYAKPTTLVKKVDDVWLVVPIRGDNASWWDIGIELPTGSSTEIILDIGLIYGQLREGEYAIIKDGSVDGKRIHVLGMFSIVAEGYEISVEDTAIATRPIIYSVSESRGWNENSEVVTQRWLSIRTIDSAVTIYIRDDYEKFDTTGMIPAESRWSNSVYPFWVSP
ncbi:MAG: hypothetical protein FWC78_01505 [Defluviitaleaceae bacterium]|nr:hypothetical protein [Defluviitaleaceae bacterium]